MVIRTDRNLRLLLVVVCVVALTAGYFHTDRVKPASEGFSIQGVALCWPDEKVQGLAGRELPESQCPEEGYHYHRYRNGLSVEFNHPDFLADSISGEQLELDGKVVLLKGDPTGKVSESLFKDLPLGEGARLVACPDLALEYFEEVPAEIGWTYTPRKGYDQVYRVAYRYRKDGSEASSSQRDFNLCIWAWKGRIESISMVWMGH